MATIVYYPSLCVESDSTISRVRVYDFKIEPDIQGQKREKRVRSRPSPSVVVGLSTKQTAVEQPPRSSSHMERS